MTYHIAFRKAHRGDVLEVHLSSDIDCLPPDIWQYRGEFTTTKKEIQENKQALLEAVNREHQTAFTTCRVF